MGHILEKGVAVQDTFEAFLEKQRRLELKSVQNSVAKTVLVDSANYFSMEYQCMPQYILKHCSTPYRPSKLSVKSIKHKRRFTNE